MDTRLPLACLFAALPLAAAAAQQLRGSEHSMVRQHRVAVRNDFSFTKTPRQVHRLVHEDRLIPVHSSRTVLLKNVSYPFARPQVALFVRRLGAQYYAANHEPLVVTSLTRPESQQPDNASPLSVHPAGMAVDLRIPDTWEKRRWLEEQLLALERRSVLDVTLELHPAHYHVAVFPTDYERYVSGLVSPKGGTALSRATVVRGRSNGTRVAHHAAPAHPPRVAHSATRARKSAARTNARPRPAQHPARSAHAPAAHAPAAHATHSAPAHSTRARPKAAKKHAPARVAAPRTTGRKATPHHSARKATTGSSRAARAAG